MAYKNLLEVFKNSVTKRNEGPCFRFKKQGTWHTLSWNEVNQKVLKLMGALKKLGVSKGDKVSILSKTRYEWTLADLAILCSGAVTVPVYESNIPEQVQYVLEHSESKLVFVENRAQLEKVLAVHKNLPYLKQIIVIEADDSVLKEEGVYLLDEALVMAGGIEEGEKVFNQMLGEVKPETEASYVYTSGTTGNPKGAVLTHSNFVECADGVARLFTFRDDMEGLLFLPLAHILGRTTQFVQIYLGLVHSYAESIDKLIDNFGEAKPHFVVAVPRIFEKVHARVLQGVQSGSALKKKIFNWALRVGKEKSKLLIHQKPVPSFLNFKWNLAYKLVFSKIHERLGGRIEFFASGGAPLALEVAEFFHAAGVLILEGYGLTETTAMTVFNTKECVRFGEVGKPSPDMKVKIAPDGEILFKGPLVFKGYYKNPEATKEAFTSDGWFQTGDIGVITSEGILKITDRKKDIIITAGGKNVAPQNIENLVKTDPYISQVMVYGDREKYLVALLTLDPQEVINYARKNGISFETYAELVKNEKIHQFIKERVDEKNKALAKFETIKKFAILDKDFSIEAGELTPSLKVKRKFTSEKYKDIIKHLYQE